MSTNGFIVSMNILRILLIVWAVGITIYLIKEVNAVKLLAYDPCKICMSKAGAICYESGNAVEQLNLNLSNLVK